MHTIKQAIERINFYKNLSPVNKEYQEALQVVVELAERAENIKGLPKKKENYPLANYDVGKEAGYNQAIDDCKLYIAKMLNEERIKEILKTQLCTNYPDFVLKVCSKCKGCKKAIRLAKAIVKELGGNQ